MRHLVWGRIEEVPEGIIIHIPLSKTIQACERIHEIPVTYCRVKDLCPISALADLVNLKGVEHCGPQDSLFSVYRMGKWDLLTKGEASRQLHRQLGEMGLNPSDYSLHSFRFGGLQEALLSESPLEFIRLHSDHKSDAIYGYLHLPARKRFLVSSRLTDRLALMMTQ